MVDVDVHVSVLYMTEGPTGHVLPTTLALYQDALLLRHVMMSDQHFWAFWSDRTFSSVVNRTGLKGSVDLLMTGELPVVLNATS